MKNLNVPNVIMAILTIALLYIIITAHRDKINIIAEAKQEISKVSKEEKLIIDLKQANISIQKTEEKKLIIEEELRQNYKEWRIAMLLRKCRTEAISEYAKDILLDCDLIDLEIFSENYNPKPEKTAIVELTKKFDINKLAYAVAMQETKNCTIWTGRFNNCFWITNWNTAPCKRMVGRMCEYDTQEESYEAFKIIWSKWYKWLPDIGKAKKWSWNDRAKERLSNVLYYYDK